jgi:hypothetical protein
MPLEVGRVGYRTSKEAGRVSCLEARPRALERDGHDKTYVCTGLWILIVKLSWRCGICVY